MLTNFYTRVDNTDGATESGKDKDDAFRYYKAMSAFAGGSLPDGRYTCIGWIGRSGGHLRVRGHQGSELPGSQS